MKKWISAALAFAMAGSMMVADVTVASAQHRVIENGGRVLNGAGNWDRGGRHWDRGGRHWDRGRDWDRGRHWRGDRRYYRHRDRGDAWAAGAAGLVTGALIGGVIANSNNQPRRVIRSGGGHVEWCYNRYRSYRSSDNTYQPYNGPRRQCNSPYS